MRKKDFFRRLFSAYISNRLLVVVFLSGILLCLIYLSYTPFNVRTYDIEGHIDYIKLIEKTHSLPENNQCWECYQRPLYYVTAASIYSFAKNLGDPTFFRILQLLSLFLYGWFLFFGILIFKLLFIEKKYIAFASALLVFWPSGIIHSARIGNDMMLYFFYAAGLYFFIKWLQTEGNKDLIAASIFAGLGTLTKTNGVMLFMVFFVFMVRKIFMVKDRKKISYAFACAMVVFLLSILPMFNDFFVSNFENSNGVGWRLVGNSGHLNTGLFVGNEVRNYTYFDIDDFLSFPYTDTWHDPGGRQYFWNFLSKTALFGEFRMNFPLNQSLAIQIGILFLFLTCYSIIGLVSMTCGLKRGFGVLVVNGALSLLILAFYRMKVPSSANADFRFIFPAVITFIAFFVVAIGELHNKKYLKLAKAGSILAGLFIFSTVAFYLNPFIINLLPWWHSQVAGIW